MATTFYSQHQASNAPASGVTSVNGITGALTLVAGSGISITPSGNNLTIATTGGTPGGSTTQVQYNNAGAFAGSAGFTWDNANTRLTIASGGSTFNSPARGQLLIEAPDGNGSLIINREGASGAPAFIFRRAQGTPASPTATLNADGLGSIFAAGYDGTGGAYAGSSVAISAVAAETFTASAHGAVWNIAATQATTTTRKNVLQVGVANPSGRSFLSLYGINQTNLFSFSWDGTSNVSFGLPTATGTNLQTLISDANGVGTWTTFSGDITSGSAGNLAIVKLQGVTLTAPTPSTNDVLKYNGTAWVNSPATGGTPGGPNTAIQYNNSGAFGGTAQGGTSNGLNFKYDGTATVELSSAAGQGVGFPIMKVGDSGGSGNYLQLIGRQNLISRAGFVIGVIGTQGNGVNDLVLGTSDTATSANTNAIRFATGAITANSGALTSGALTFDSGPGTGATNSGNLLFTSGTSGSGTTGNLTFATGTTSGTRGTIRFQDGSQGTANRLWISTDTNGSGTWSSAAGFTGTVSPVTSITVVNGIVTAVS